MSADDQATLDAWTPETAAVEAEPTRSDDRDERPDSTPHDGGGLASVFEAVTGETTIVDAQREAPSHAPIEDSDHEAPVIEDGLDDATESGEGWT